MEIKKVSRYYKKQVCRIAYYAMLLIFKCLLRTFTFLQYVNAKFFEQCLLFGIYEFWRPSK